MPDSSVNPRLIAAYERTRYAVTGHDTTFFLTLGESSEELYELYRKYNVTSAAFMTAWNPRSEPLSDEINANAQKSLLTELESNSWVVLPALGEDILGE